MIDHTENRMLVSRGDSVLQSLYFLQWQMRVINWRFVGWCCVILVLFPARMAFALDPNFYPDTDADEFNRLLNAVASGQNKTIDLDDAAPSFDFPPATSVQLDPENASQEIAFALDPDFYPATDADKFNRLLNEVAGGQSLGIDLFELAPSFDFLKPRSVKAEPENPSQRPISPESASRRNEPIVNKPNSTAFKHRGPMPIIGPPLPEKGWQNKLPEKSWQNKIPEKAWQNNNLDKKLPFGLEEMRNWLSQRNLDRKLRGIGPTEGFNSIKKYAGTLNPRRPKPHTATNQPWEGDMQQPDPNQTNFPLFRPGRNGRLRQRPPIQAEEPSQWDAETERAYAEAKSRRSPNGRMRNRPAIEAEEPGQWNPETGRAYAEAKSRRDQNGRTRRRPDPDAEGMDPAQIDPESAYAETKNRRSPNGRIRRRLDLDTEGLGRTQFYSQSANTQMKLKHSPDGRFHHRLDGDAGGSEQFQAELDRIYAESKLRRSNEGQGRNHPVIEDEGSDQFQAEPDRSAEAKKSGRKANRRIRHRLVVNPAGPDQLQDETGRSYADSSSSEEDASKLDRLTPRGKAAWMAGSSSRAPASYYLKRKGWNHPKYQDK